MEYYFNNGGKGLLAIDQELEIISDRSVLIRILSNLLQNACKYTKTGSVSLSVGLVPDDSSTNTYQFIIEDTGIGIEESKIPDLFKPFTQVDSSYSRPYEGVGLGLAICGKLIKILGGDIEVSSQLNKGSCFKVSIPFNSSETAQQQIQLPERQAPLKLKRSLNVLIVEDVADNMNVTRALITRLGGTPFTAYDGSEALAHCQKQKFDAILMDLRMAGMDGFEATTHIKKDNARNAQTPIIALTANVADSTKQQCLEYGFAAFVPKPVVKQKLYDTLNQICLE